MNSSRKNAGREIETVSLRDKLVETGLSPHIADVLAEMPQRRVQLDGLFANPVLPATK